MKKAWKVFILSGLMCLLVVTGKTSQGWTQSQNEQKSGSTGLQQRIDFGNAYIMGQSIKSGAVYLLHRKQSDIKSMLQYREDYRQEILEDFIIQEEKIQNADPTRTSLAGRSEAEIPLAGLQRSVNPDLSGN